MRRFVYLIAALSVVLTACGGSTVSTTSPETVTASTAGSTAATDTSQPTDPSDNGEDVDVPTTEEAPAVPVATDFDGPAAEDFSVELNRSGTFTLSAEARPVYLVFWAEW